VSTPRRAWRHTRTARLLLDVAVEADVDDLHAIHADPGSWRHFPGGRHLERAQSAAMVGAGERQFAAHGLGYWSVREAAGPPGSPGHDDADAARPVVGRGGCAVPVNDEGLAMPWWNLYYRLAASVQGRGYATELGRHAIEAAHDVDPDRPVMAFLLEHNEASRRTAEAVGLHLVWRGPDRDNPDPGAVRLVYLDREPDAVLSRVLAAQS
jgi:RimJ/RimL family protein N-acetyltransferase